jgi:hypothetical protein
LEIEGSVWGYETECVIMAFEIDLGARMDISEIEEPEELVFGTGLVVRQVCWTQHEPPLLPRLRHSNNRVTTIS